MAGSVPNPSRYLHEGAIRSAAVEFATATHLDVLGLRPSIGRWFDEPEERPAAPLGGILGYQTWTRVFRADRSIVGRVIRIEGARVTIVGVKDGPRPTGRTENQAPSTKDHIIATDGNRSWFAHRSL